MHYDKSTPQLMLRRSSIKKYRINTASILIKKFPIGGKIMKPNKELIDKIEEQLALQPNSDDPKCRTISILFSTYTDFISRLVGFVSGFGCTHVSISLDDKDEYFYAFNTKGFHKEYPKKHRKRTKENTCIRLQVTENQYNTIRSRLMRLEREQKSEKKKKKYDYFGVILCMFRLNRPKKTKKRYFCSSFIAELLHKSKVINLKKSNTRYLPYQLQKELLLCPLIIGIAQNIFL